jgi:hypothetical protein
MQHTGYENFEHQNSQTQFSYIIATNNVSYDTMVSCGNHLVIALRFGND